jgi:putative transposase
MPDRVHMLLRMVSTVGRDEQVIRAYIRNQETEDQRLDQLQLLR